MKDWQLIFGNSLTRAVKSIQLDALKKNTVEAYEKAIHQLDGIDCLLTCMGFQADVIIRLMNEIRRLEQFKRAVQ